MAVKTVTIDLEAYGLLTHRKQEGQSFSDVIKAHFGRQPTAGGFPGAPPHGSGERLRARRDGRAGPISFGPSCPSGQAVIHFDSSYLIDLLRETARDRPGDAWDFIESLEPDEPLAVSVHVVAELRAGAELSRRPLKEHEVLDRVLGGLVVAYPDARFAPTYGRLLAATQRGSRAIATMDLLIATAAVLADAPLVTRNVKDFSRVPGLRVLSY